MVRGEMGVGKLQLRLRVCVVVLAPAGLLVVLGVLVLRWGYAAACDGVELLLVLCYCCWC